MNDKYITKKKEMSKKNLFYTLNNNFSESKEKKFCLECEKIGAISQ